MSAPDVILRLVERFTEQHPDYMAGRYNEAQVRREFIDPLFEALGWDVHNKQGYAEAYKEVIHEDSIRVAEEVAAPDYCFRIGSERKFFVEAKKPSVSLKDQAEPAFQLRRYAWSRKLPLSILTDFEEFAVYDCRNQPKKTDKSSVDRIEYFTYLEYPDRWDYLLKTFSKEAILRGSFDRYAQDKKTKRGTTEVDAAFLKEIELWREELAKNLARRNDGLSQRELNTSVQRTIDRLVFFRICEDRGIEEYGRLQKLIDQGDIYSRLVELFHRADEKYNSGLFYFRKEKGRSGVPDELSLSLSIDDKVLKQIVGRLYYPESPYVFSEIPSEILGQVYEQFLGKVIRLTKGHQAKVEEKPEVRKAGGVYYTPTYIVDYIVEHTVGKLLEGKTPKAAEGLRILDPACGSGSFLLGAYKYLLDWHLKYYLAHDPVKWTKGREPALVRSAKTDYRLSTALRKSILLNNLYGVDIDPQAVEVTKLSLLLKVLEGETEDSLAVQQRLFHQRALPDLGNNIKCGNSLIGPDFYHGKQSSLFDEEEAYRVNAFDWKGKDGFADIMKAGGFDAVIGNPPYVRQEGLGEFKDYFHQSYDAYSGTSDLYVPFIERGVTLLRSGGSFSYIVANKWMRANYGASLRNWLKGKCIEEIVDFGDLPVFKNATTYPCILRICNRPKQKSFEALSVASLDFQDLTEYVEENRFTVNYTSLDDSGWSLVDEAQQALLNKIKGKGVPLGRYVGGKIYYGIKTGLNEAFVIDAETRNRLIKREPKSAELIKPFLAGRDVKRYTPPVPDKFLICIPKGWTNKRYPKEKNKWKSFESDFPSLVELLEPHAARGEGRYDKGDYWWELRTCEYYEEFVSPKVIVPCIVKSASYTFDRSGCYSNDKTSIISITDLYFLGVLNSKLSDLALQQIASTKQGGYFEYKPMYVERIPIRPIDFSNPSEKKQHDRMVSLVERMLDLHKRKQGAKTGHEQSLIERQIAGTDAEIDRLVYELYDLSEEEIRIVEEAVAR